MKAVFPTKGVIIVTKYNVNVLRDFYKNTLIDSKMFAIYQQSNYSLQLGNLNYFPKKSNFILYNTHLLTIEQLQEVVSQQVKEKEQEKAQSQAAQPSNVQEEVQEEPTYPHSSEPLDDNFIKNNPFFQTLISTDD